MFEKENIFLTESVDEEKPEPVVAEDQDQPEKLDQEPEPEQDQEPEPELEQEQQDQEPEPEPELEQDQEPEPELEQDQEQPEKLDQEPEPEQQEQDQEPEQEQEPEEPESDSEQQDLELEQPDQEPELQYVSHEVEVSVQEIYADKISPKSDIPEIVFIVPYRDRKSHYDTFSKHMEYILADVPNYKIYYIHQLDDRGFNRGAIKNIGFRMVRNKWPDNYKSITLVFNDVDSMPKTPGLLNYATVPNVIKHFYGFRHTLGGIVSITAGDFEKINGFPNFWAWGYEDNMLDLRAKKNGIEIDRSVFFGINDPSILRLSESTIRPVNKTEFYRYINNTQEGITSIYNLTYYIDESTGFVNVYKFVTSTPESKDTTVNYDLRKGPVPFKGLMPRRKRGTISMQLM